MSSENNIPINFKKLIKSYLNFVSLEKGLSENTKVSYQNDLRTLALYLELKGKESFSDLNYLDVTSFLEYLAELGLSAGSRARYISSIRGFLKYLLSNGKLELDFIDKIELPKAGRKLPDTLSIEEVSLIIDAPDTTKAGGIRDKAMLETLYACGLRVSELINLRQRDLYLEQEVIRVVGKGSKERIIPIGLSAAKGICYGVDIPLISISSLKILAKSSQFDGYIISTMDARRDEIYSCIYDSKLNIIREEKPEIVNKQTFVDFSEDNKILIIGDGQSKCKNLIEINNNFNFDENILKPSSKDMVELAFEKFRKKNFENLAYFEPKYLKEFRSN